MLLLVRSAVFELFKDIADMVALFVFGSNNLCNNLTTC